MLILGMDTATPWGTMALVEDETPIGEIALNTGKGGGEYLLSLTTLLFAKTGRRPADLDMITTGIGPGSYTGIRVGLAAVKGLAEGLDIPVYPLSTLRIIAENARYASGEWVAVALDARRGEVYAGLYRKTCGDLVGEWRPEPLPAADFAHKLSQYEGVMLCGNGGKVNRELWGSGNKIALAPDLWDRPYATQAALIAFREQRPETLMAPDTVAPAYLRQVVFQGVKK